MHPAREDGQEEAAATWREVRGTTSHGSMMVLAAVAAVAHRLVPGHVPVRMRTHPIAAARETWLLRRERTDRSSVRAGDENQGPFLGGTSCQTCGWRATKRDLLSGLFTCRKEPVMVGTNDGQQPGPRPWCSSSRSFQVDFKSSKATRLCREKGLRGCGYFSGCAGSCSCSLFDFVQTRCSFACACNFLRTPAQSSLSYTLPIPCQNRYAHGCSASL